MNDNVNLDDFNIAVYTLDDNEDDLDAIKKRVEQVLDVKIKCHYFTNPRKFIAALAEGVQICIIDDSLPEMDGLEVLRVIKEKNKYTFVIGYSALQVYKKIIKYLNNDCDRWVDKNEGDHLDVLSDYLLFGLSEAKVRIESLEILQREYENLNDRRRKI